MNDEVIRITIDQYLEDDGFKGTPPSKFLKEFDLDSEKLKRSLLLLLDEDKIQLNLDQGNFYIKRFSLDSKKEEQKSRLKQSDLNDFCVFPSPTVLRECVDGNNYIGRPFSLRRVQGEAEFIPCFFHPEVLGRYLVDPRYCYKNENGFSGSFDLSDGACASDRMRTADKCFLQTFGTAYNASGTRSVVVWLHYLSILTPEHQQHWNSYCAEGDYKIHPEYCRVSLGGCFPEGISVYQAFVEEQEVINEVCRTLSKPLLFRNVQHPKEFNDLLMPTKKAFHDFVLEWDKIFSDNLNKKFFEGEGIELKFTEGENKDGDKGTLTLLKEWWGAKIDFENYANDITRIFWDVRAERSRKAHSISLNDYDESYFQKQIDWIARGWMVIVELRKVFESQLGQGILRPSEKMRGKKVWIGCRFSGLYLTDSGIVA